jgi:NADH-quinone oxidoreductase subunit C
VSERPTARRGLFDAPGPTPGAEAPSTGMLPRQSVPPSSPRPFGGYFDEVADELERVVPDLGDAVERVVVDRGELTVHVRRERLPELAGRLRDDPRLRFEVCHSVSGVDYPADPTGRRLHAVYQVTSLTHRRRIRLEVAVSDADPHIPSVTAVWPGANWHERETWDMFGIVFDGHPWLTRILMPDDWPGHPQRKDYPLGGIAVEYKGAQVPPPDERRAYA